MVDLTGTLAVLCSLLGIPLIVFGFVYINNKGKRSVELTKLRNETLRLELEKEKIHVRLLEAENQKYDRIIAQDDRKTTI